LITHTTTLQLLFEDGTEQIEKFYLTKIDEEHPWVLGYDWLRRRNPEINWSEPSIILDQNHEKARAIRLFEMRDQASNCSNNISNKENSNFQDTEDQIQRISDRKRKKGVPLFGTTGITKAMTSLLRKNMEYQWNDKCETAFQILKKAFTEAPVLQHYDPEDMIVLESDASDYAIAGILSQYDKEGFLRPGAFYGRTMIAAELNYDIYDKELLAIVECFRLW
jgi:hypothetical protein